MSEIPHLSEDEADSQHDEGADQRLSMPKADREDDGGDGKVFVGTGFFWGLVVGVLLATMIIILAAQNTASVEVRFLGWAIETPLIVLILGSLLIGIVLDEIAGLFYRRRRRRILNERVELERLRGD